MYFPLPECIAWDNLIVLGHNMSCRKAVFVCMCETHGVPVRVAGEVDLCGSLVYLMTGLSISVVQDELVSNVTQKLVCHSCANVQM